MERPKRTFVCEECGEDFRASNNREILHCGKCADQLRSEGHGPRQLKRRAEASTSPVIQSVTAHPFDWSMAEEDLLYYLERFSKTVQRYDAATPEEVNTITDSDRRLANLVAARMGERIWRPLVGHSIEDIGPWDLLPMSDSDWECRKEVIRSVVAKLVDHPGIGIARLTKGLHRKRPNLIPVCDSVVRKALDVDGGGKADRIVLCLDRLRAEGQANLGRLDGLRNLAKSRGAELTQLRILELLYWVQYGPFPREEWKQSGSKS